MEAAIKAGATTINIPDTVGYTMPEEYRALFEHGARTRAQFRQGDLLGPLPRRSGPGGRQLASPALQGGARQIECTINGIGERAGNAALEEIVMALRTRADVLPYRTGIEATMLTRASTLVSAVTVVPGAVQQGDRRPERLRP